MTTPDARWHRWGLAAVVVVQAVVFTLAAAPGYFVTDDLQFLYDAAPDAPTWSYLTLRVNDHLAPGLRLCFWLIRHGTGLDHGPTVVVRVVLLAALTVLAHHVLTQLLGRRPIALVGTALYALNPVLLTATTWVATSTNQVPSQLLVLGAMSCHIRYVRTGRLRFAGLAGVGLFLAACFWESSAIVGVTFFWLSAGFLNPGTAGQRLRATARQWRGWLLELAGPVVFAVLFVLSGYGSGAATPSAGTLLDGIWQQWAYTTAPSLVGGPWRWFHVPTVFVSAADPRLSWAVALQVLLLALVVLGWRRLGPRVLYALAVPASVTVLGVVAISLGRLTFLGLLISRTISYAVIALFPAVLFVVLIVGWSADASDRPVRPDESDRPIPAVARRRRPARLAVVVTAVVLLASTVVSVSRFATTWHRNPTGPYVAALDRSLREAGPGVQLYDVPVAPDVLQLLSDRRELSYLTDLMGADVDYVPTDESGKIPDDHGRLRPTSYFRYTSAAGDGNAFCGNLVTGVEPRTMRVERPLGAADYVVRLAYFQQHPTPVSVRIEQADGRTSVPLTGSRVILPGTGGIVYLSFPTSAVATVTVSSDAADANVCLTDVGVGYPFVRSGS